MRWFYLSISIFIYFESIAQEQNQFNIVPFVGGIENQSQGLIVLPDSNEFYIMGDLLDSVVVSGETVTRPYLSRFDYQGDLIATYIITDSLGIGKFNIDTRPVIKDGTSIIALIERVNQHFGYDPFLFKLDLKSGKILKSKTFEYAPTIDNSHKGEWYYKNQEEEIISFHFLQSERRIFIRRVDKEFNVISEILVEENGRWNVPNFIEFGEDSTYVIIGTSIAPPGGPFPESKIFFMRVSETGDIIDFKLAPGLDYKSILFTSANSYTVLKDSQGNWIVSVGILNIIESNPIVYNIVPIAISLSPNFDSTQWINYFSNISIDTFQFYNLTGVSWTRDKESFVVAGYDFSQTMRSSFITKITTTGEILWTRTFVPLGWDSDDFAWANIQDIKLTPFNTFMAVGVIYDNIKMIRQPWIIHIDSMGCVVPGCDLVNANEMNLLDIKDKIKVYPNPTSNQLYLSFSDDDLDISEYVVSLFDISGKMIKSLKIDPIGGFQYILSLLEIPTGIYVLKISNKFNEILKTEEIIKY